jgi:hypothetical protein
MTAPHLPLKSADILTLQSTIGNQYVQKMFQHQAGLSDEKRGESTYLRSALVPAIQRDDDTKKPDAGTGTAVRKDYAFIMGKGDSFYTYATKYYRSQLSKAQVVTKARSLPAVIDYLNKLGTPVGNLYIVTHASPDGTLSFTRRSRVSYGQLRSALEKPTTVFNLDEGIIDKNTTIHIKGCRIGRAKRMLELVSEAFGGKASVKAPSYVQVFARKRRGGLYEALEGYYIELPGKQTLLGTAAIDAFSKKYPKRLPRAKLVKILRKHPRWPKHKTRKIPLTIFKQTIPTGKQLRAVSRQVRRYRKREDIRSWFSGAGKGRRKLVSYSMAQSKTGAKHAYAFEIFDLKAFRQKAQRHKQDWKSLTKRERKEERSALAQEHTKGWQVNIIVPGDKKAMNEAQELAKTQVARSWNTYKWVVMRYRKSGREIVKVVGRITEAYIPIEVR